MSKVIKPRKDNENMFKKMVLKKYPPCFKSEIFAEEVFKFCSDYSKNHLTKRIRCAIFYGVFEDCFKKEIAQCPDDVLQDLLLYKEKYFNLNSKEDFMELDWLEQKELAEHLKKFIVALFPLSPFRKQLLFSRLILFYLSIPVEMQKRWIGYVE